MSISRGIARTVKLRIALLAVLITACNNQRDAAPQETVDTMAIQTAEPSYSGPKACDLLTAAEVVRVTGLSVQPGTTFHDYGGDSQCRFAVANDSVAAVMVTLHMSGKIAPYQKVPGSVAVSGLGDAAVWNPNVFQIAVARGDAVLSIAFLAVPAVKQAWATRLAHSALARLEARQD